MHADYDSDDDGPELTVLGHVIVYLVLAALVIAVIAAANTADVRWPDWGLQP